MEEGLDYFIYWIDKYTGGYRTGASHAVKDGEDKTLCGISIAPMQWDGGYNKVDDTPPECKRCLNKLNKINNE